MENRSEGQGLLAAALAKAQGSFLPIRKNRRVTVVTKAKDGRPPGSYSFQYATLDAVIDATRDALSANELALSHIYDNGVLTVELLHSSGESRASRFPMPDPLKVGWQEFGSAVTYATRYGASPMIGVAAESDDDGNAAEGNRIENMETDINPWDELWDDLESKGYKDTNAVRTWIERCLQRLVPSQRDLTDADLPLLREYLEGKPLPPARTMATAAELKALNQAIDALAPWGTTDKTGEELVAMKKAAKKAWINRMLDPKPAKPIEASAELTQEQALALTKRALAGEV